MSSAFTVQHQTFELQGSQTLFAQSWTPDSTARGIIGIVHGLGEHSSRYTSLAELVARAGFQVITYDQRGHGRTSGKRGDAPSYDVLLDDVERLLAEMGAGDKRLPKFLYGHSLGGNLVLNLALRRRPSVSGIVASSPLLLPTQPPPPWKQAAGRLLRRVYASFQFRMGIKAEDLSHDPAAVAAYKADPLVHGLVSARVAVAMLDAGRWAMEHAADLTTPTLLLHGTSDAITSAPATIQFAQRAGAICTLQSFAGLYHELHSERERDEVLRVVLDWIIRQRNDTLDSK